MLQIWHDPPGKKKQICPCPEKNAPNGDISSITEKDDIHPRKYSISAEIPHRLTPEKGHKKQSSEIFYKKRCS